MKDFAEEPLQKVPFGKNFEKGGARVVLRKNKNFKILGKPANKGIYKVS